MSPVWVSIIMGVVGVVFAAGVAWGIVQIKLSRVESDSKGFQRAIKGLENTIREEFDKAISRINKLLFEENGRTRYVLRDDCRDCRDECRRQIEHLIDQQ